MKDINKIISEITTRLKSLNPSKIILFGSYAWGKPGPNSDLDIYVITNENFIPSNWQENKSLFLPYYRCLSDLNSIIAIDIITHTLPMAQTFREKQSSFSKEILNKGRILYES